jgi:hypothetical protein
MIKSTSIQTELSFEQVKKKISELGNEIGYFVIEKDDRIKLKRELQYSNGTSSVIQDYTFLFVSNDSSKNEIMITLDISSNFINKTVERLYVTEQNTQESLNSMRNVIECVLTDDLPRSSDLQIIAGEEPPTSTGLKTFMYLTIVFAVAIIMFALNKCN